MQASETVHICLLQYDKSDILCIGNFSSLSPKGYRNIAMLLDCLGEGGL